MSAIRAGVGEAPIASPDAPATTIEKAKMDAVPENLQKLQDILKQLPGCQEYYHGLFLAAYIHVKKNADYAQVKSNGLSNFVLSASKMGYPIVDVFRFNIYQKLERLENLDWGEKSASNEAIEDTLIDMANYLLLFRAAKVIYGVSVFDTLVSAAVLEGKEGKDILDLQQVAEEKW